jgi:hypothetical protein
MKRRSSCTQCDLFSSDPVAPTLADLQLHHEELVELLSRLLWEVAADIGETTAKEDGDDQDQL